MKEIELTRGYVSKVDDSDFNALNSFKWHVFNGGHQGNYVPYAMRSVGTGNQKRNINMARDILNAPAGMVVDHINGDTLDNRRSNLRLCTNPENLRNRGKSKANTSGFKGVFWDKKLRRWRAAIDYNRKKINLGVYPTAELAALAYDKAARKYHGDFSKTNF